MGWREDAFKKRLRETLRHALKMILKKYPAWF